MMGISNEHQLKFNSINDAKKLMEAVKKRFGGNAATRKTQMNLLKQQSKNFTAPSSEMLDQTFERLQNLMSQFELLEEKLLQEYVNQKLLKRLSQIHPYDMEEIALRWKMAILTMRARRFLKNTGRKLTVNGNETIGFDKSKVECYNFYKRRHFARECRASRNQDNKNKESSKGAEEGPNFVIMAFSFLSSDSKFVNKPVVENYKVMSSEKEPKVVRKYDDAPRIKEWVSDGEEEDVSQPKIEKKTFRPSIVKIEFVKSKQQKNY
nr:hypothetical protein [Tanacetum cinerariifolium]